MITAQILPQEFRKEDLPIKWVPFSYIESTCVNIGTNVSVCKSSCFNTELMKKIIKKSYIFV